MARRPYEALSRGEKARRTRAANKRRLAREQAQAQGRQAGNGGNGNGGAAVQAQAAAQAQAEASIDGRLGKLERFMEATNLTIRKIIEAVFGKGQAETIAAPVESEADRSKRQLVEQLQAQLAALTGQAQAQAETVPTSADAPILQPGSYTPQDQFLLPILRVLDSLPNGTGHVRAQIYPAIEKLVPLMPMDRGRLAHGAVRWENSVAFMREKAKAMGFLERDQPRGFWKISDEGRKFLRQQLAAQQGQGAGRR